MPRMDQGFEVGPARALRAIDARIARAPAARTQAEAPVPAGPPVATGGALDPGEPPVDAERVDLIRKAVADGAYPVVPAEIADAIIAAGLLLRIPPNG